MATNMPSRIQTFVVFDLEGTGLPSQPSDYPVRIMELSMVAVQRPGGCGAPQVQRQHLQATTEAELTHRPPSERGLTTPKRPIRVDDRLDDAGLARSRARPRLAGCETPPTSDNTSDDGEGEQDGVISPVPTPPRVRNSLLLTVSPRKPIAAIVTDITDLDNEMLEPHSVFDRDLAEMLRVYLKRLPAPVCLIAHNGTRYDFPLLKAELLHADPTWFDSSELVCADSLVYFRAAAAGRDRAESSGADDTADVAVYPLDPTTLSCGHDAADDVCIVCNPGMWLPDDECDTNVDFEFTRVGGRRAIRCLHAADRRCLVCENVPRYRRAAPRARRQLFPGRRSGGGPRPSMKLPDVYQRRFGVSPERSHCAADDVEALMLLCLSHGERFFDWADRNHSPLRTVKEMWSRGVQRAAPQVSTSDRPQPCW